MFCVKKQRENVFVLLLSWHKTRWILRFGRLRRAIRKYRRFSFNVTQKTVKKKFQTRQASGKDAISIMYLNHYYYKILLIYYYYHYHHHCRPSSRGASVRVLSFFYRPTARHRAINLRRILHLCVIIKPRPRSRILLLPSVVYSMFVYYYNPAVEMLWALSIRRVLHQTAYNLLWKKKNVIKKKKNID